MSNSLNVVLLCVASMLAIGCQPSADQARPTGKPAVSPMAGLESGPPAEPGKGAVAPNADPGMDPNRDKTPAEELPSGDESSRAAPNDGDAAPPARP
ncbi:MAG: hypothetical protein ACREJM_07240 [Candidatus Saccharimonadales bacterium]